MNTLQQLEDSRNLTETHLIGFPKWFEKTEWEVIEYMHGGALRKAEHVTIDFFEAISFFNYEKHPIKNVWIIQAIAKQNGQDPKIITLKRKE